MKTSSSGVGGCVENGYLPGLALRRQLAITFLASSFNSGHQHVKRICPLTQQTHLWEPRPHRHSQKHPQPHRGRGQGGPSDRCIECAHRDVRCPVAARFYSPKTRILCLIKKLCFEGYLMLKDLMLNQQELN